MCLHSLHDIGSSIYQATAHRCRRLVIPSRSLATMAALDWRQGLAMGHQDAIDHYVALGILFEQANLAAAAQEEADLERIFAWILSEDEAEVKGKGKAEGNGKVHEAKARAKAMGTPRTKAKAKADWGP